MAVVHGPARRHLTDHRHRPTDHPRRSVTYRRMPRWTRTSTVLTGRLEDSTSSGRSHCTATRQRLNSTVKTDHAAALAIAALRQQHTSLAYRPNDHEIRTGYSSHPSIQQQKARSGGIRKNTAAVQLSSSEMYLRLGNVIYTIYQPISKFQSITLTSSVTKVPH